MESLFTLDRRLVQGIDQLQRSGITLFNLRQIHGDRRTSIEDLGESLVQFIRGPDGLRTRDLQRRVFPTRPVNVFDERRGLNWIFGGIRRDAIDDGVCGPRQRT